MKSLINGLGSGFGRSIGRILGLIFLGFVIYFLFNALDINIKDIIPKVSIGGVGILKGF